MWLDTNITWYADQRNARQDDRAVSPLSSPFKEVRIVDNQGEYNNTLHRNIKISTLLATILPQDNNGRKRRFHTVAPLPDIQEGQILTKDDLIQYSSDEFTLSDDIIPPEADPKYHTTSISQSDAYKDAILDGTTYLQSKLSTTLQGH